MLLFRQLLNRKLLFGLIGLISTLSPGAALAQGRSMPPPPAAPVTIYRPDQATCQSENMLGAYRRQLQQFAGQSTKVLIRLREVQLELAEGSLKNCASQNLLSRDEAERIWRELQAMPLPQPAASQRP
ncbi:MAG: hypothetical protein HQ527_10455 [Cyanobacteria bacterium]|nr:hypothetical protein [Cyanobacteria bacterium bin.51]